MNLRQSNFSAFSSPIAAIILLTSLLAGSLTFVSGQSASNSTTSPLVSKLEAHPFEPTEELVYVAEFSRALLKKVDIADFRFTATKQSPVEKILPASFNQQPAGAPYLLKLTGDVSSKGFFSKLFNLRFREQIESIVEPRSFTVQLTKKIDEQGKRARVSETTYRDGKVVWTETDPNNPSRPERKAEASFAGQVQDVLSAIYYLRTQPLRVGENFEITVSDSGVVYQVPVLVVEKKKKKTVLGRVDVLRVDPQVFGPGKLLAGDGQFSIWITDDRKRIPVSARIKMKYGTFDINLRKVIANPRPQAVASNSN
jgi:Protein of unknown function (DUF3108)